MWGPSYASGASVSGRIGQFDYAAEIKNSSLSSRPESWSVTENGFDDPSFNARLGFRPNQVWNFGVSAGEGPYLRPEAERTLPRGRDLDDYGEVVLRHEASFAPTHLQPCADVYQDPLATPSIAHTRTVPY